ncbi:MULTISPECIES: VRR-NUC domain-containing protein [Burkholderia]|uniref:VRR-NUC domain-containing protein n=1 Tax=Burkholderia paludis TaxID=1506587 RepID=A0A6J5D746_9BURK|nr:MULTISPECIES: VRR-NUC domain-containing protein [Burkholderia]CAB3748705.1 hypothetical protein LMG30113_00765 [Burkholderia paludis]VWB96366.1 hypothetical protein BPA30113_04498 [Burkholderia paludis]
MTQKPGKSAPRVPKAGKSSRTTQPENAGTVLPVENPMDLWYLCQKAGFAEKFPMIDSEGRALKQRQVTRWVHYDCKLSGWQWPYWGEVGFNMLPDSGRPPEAIMSRREPSRPSTMPLSRYEIVRRRVAFQAGIDSGALPWVQIGLEEPLVTTEYLENNLSPDEVREAYKLVQTAGPGWDWVSGRPKIPGLLRIPDVIRVRDFRGRTGVDRFAADNIEFLVEIKFEGDRLTPDQVEDYRKIVNHDRIKFRELQTKACKASRRRRREWLEKARNSEPVYRTVAGRVTSPERLKELSNQLPQAALLLEDLEAEHRSVRRLFEVARPVDGQREMAELRAWDPAKAQREEQARQRVRQQLTLVLGAPLAAAAAGTAAVGIGTLAEAGAVLGESVQLVGRGAETLARFPVGRVAVTGAAANAAIFEAAAKTSDSPSGTNQDGATQRTMKMFEVLNRGLSLRVLYQSD